METLKSFTRARPRLHAIAMNLNQKQERLRGLPARRSARRALAGAGPTGIRLAVTQEAGLGGLLLQGASALDLGRRQQIPVRLEMRSPTYAPPNFGGGDWLDLYFQRTTNSEATSGAPLASITDLIHPHAPHLAVREAADLVWGYMEISKELRDQARPWCAGEPYVAAHYRGSDKRYEAPRVDPAEFLNRVEDCMARARVTRVFIASDEPSFISVARARFGRRAFALPQQAVAVGNTAPHFSTVAGSIKAHEALLTMLVLAGGVELIRTASYLSEWAHTLAAATQIETVVKVRA